MLSGSTCQALDLITVNKISSIQDSEDSLIIQYEDVCQGMGYLPRYYHNEVDPTVPPVQLLPRRVPLPLKDQLKEKIEELEHRGVIKQVNEPTPWISSMITVIKPRICIDLRNLNKAILHLKKPDAHLRRSTPKASKCQALFST